MHPEIARQIREGVEFGKAWAYAARSGTPIDFLEGTMRRFRLRSGKLSRKSMEKTLHKHGIVKHRGMYYWLYDRMGA